MTGKEFAAKYAGKRCRIVSGYHKGHTGRVLGWTSYPYDEGSVIVEHPAINPTQGKGLNYTVARPIYGGIIVRPYAVDLEFIATTAPIDDSKWPRRCSKCQRGLYIGFNQIEHEPGVGCES